MELLTEEHVQNTLMVPKGTLQRWRCTGYWPKFVKLGRRVFYRPHDVEAFIEGQVCQSTLEGKEKTGV